MSVEDAFRALIRNEIESQLAPLRDALELFRARAGDLEALGVLAHQLSPLTALFAPAGAAAPLAPRVVRGRRGRPAGPGSSRGCAIRGCRRPARTKGYCAAHYQKLRMLTRTNRRPSAWVDFAPQGSVDDVVLPRGRAAAKAKRAAAASA
ncbi:MAG TPA: cell wall protein [Myxococcaceae bacterium]|jgi:hypothetical protein|nr:cell wall protein [Myxococcaceae bacterium]